ncbi:MAG: restriction endonuclease [Gallionella sp.]|jgi:restriction system protein
MARRRSYKKDEHLISVLLDAPWQLGAGVAAVVFVAMRWIIPSFFHSPILAPLGVMISGLAPIAAIFFLIISLVSYVRNRKYSMRTAVSAPTEKSYEHAFQPYKRTAFDKPTSEQHTTEWSNVSQKQSQPTKFSIELLRKLEWRRFEILSAEYFRVLGKRVETIDHGADGGVDARVYVNGSNVLEYAIQCKAWKKIVGVKEIRELFGVMVHESVGKGVFLATSTFSDDAKSFAAEHSDKLFLIDGEKFISMLLKLPEDKQKILLSFATEGDYTTPTCASCGIKMVLRNGAKGDFWGCINFPKCNSRLWVAQA